MRHPDPTLPPVIFNHQNPKFQNRDVRWALALVIDIKAVVDGLLSRRRDDLGDRRSRRPARIRTTITSRWRIGSTSVRDRHRQEGDQALRPDDRAADRRHAAALDGRPDPERSGRRSRAAFGSGWWKQDPEAAAQLLERAGFTRRGNDWYMPNGERFSIKLMVEGEARPVMTRAGTMIAQQWRQFGIDATTEIAAGGVPDAAQRRRLRGDHLLERRDLGRPSRPLLLPRQLALAVRPAGRARCRPPRNWQRWSNPELDKIIEQIRAIAFDDPKGIELGQEFVKLAVQRDADHPADVLQRVHGDG